MIIEVKNLVAGYGQRVLIRNLSFSVPAPAFIAIIGHNGAGKTTLFKAFQQKVDYEGHLLVQGKDLEQLPDATEQGLLSYLPQKNTVGFPIKVHNLVLVEGNYRNIKITTPEDLVLAEAFAGSGFSG